MVLLSGWRAGDGGKYLSAVASNLYGRIAPRILANFEQTSFSSFSAFKRAMGPAGPGQAWHHVIEQNASNVAKFGPEAIHNTGNLMKLPHGAGSIHAKVSGFYSSKQPFTAGQTVRQWVGNQSYQQQYDFGIKTLNQFGWKP